MENEVNFPVFLPNRQSIELIRLDNPSLTKCQSIYIFQRILIDIGNLRVFDLLYQRVISLSIENHKTKYEDYSQGTCQIL